MMEKAYKKKMLPSQLPLAALTPRELSALNRDQLAAVISQQTDKLTSDQLAALISGQVAELTSRQKAILRREASQREIKRRLEAQQAPTVKLEPEPEAPRENLTLPTNEELLALVLAHQQPQHTQPLAHQQRHRIKSEPRTERKAISAPLIPRVKLEPVPESRSEEDRLLDYVLALSKATAEEEDKRRHEMQAMQLLQEYKNQEPIHHTGETTEEEEEEEEAKNVSPRKKLKVALPEVASGHRKFATKRKRPGVSQPATEVLSSTSLSRPRTGSPAPSRPRTSSPEPSRSPRPRDCLVPRDWNPDSFYQDLTPAQRRVASYYRDHPDDKQKKGLIVVAPPGAGKTLTSVASARCALQNNSALKIIVIAPSSTHAQWKEAFVQYGFPEQDIKIIAEKKRFDPSDLGHEVVILTQQSSHHLLGNVCDNAFLIVDEGHNLRTSLPISDRESRSWERAEMGLKPKKKKGVLAQNTLTCAHHAKKLQVNTATPMVNSVEDLNNLFALTNVSGTPFPSFTENMSPEYFKYLVQCRVAGLTAAETKEFEKYLPKLVYHNPETRTREIEMTHDYHQKYKDLEEKRMERAAAKKSSRGEHELRSSKGYGIISALRQAANKIDYLSWQEWNAMAHYMAEKLDEMKDPDPRIRQAFNNFEAVLKKYEDGRPPTEIVDESKEMKPIHDQIRKALKPEVLNSLVVDALLHANPKLAFVMKELEQTQRRDHPLRVFIISNFEGSGVQMIQDVLDRKGWKYSAITGKTKKSDRKPALQKYNSGQTNIMLSTAAGREGVDLVNTDVVIELEANWNEANSIQGINRARRYKKSDLKQHPTVRVERLRYVRPQGSGELTGTIDQRLQNIANEKQVKIDPFMNLLQENLYEAKECGGNH